LKFRFALPGLRNKLQRHLHDSGISRAGDKAEGPEGQGARIDKPIRIVELSVIESVEEFSTVDGQLRRLLVEANRNGFFYILDRTNGKFLSATRFVDKLNWATGIDANGRPLPSRQ
jgi:hypothetical protein